MSSESILRSESELEDSKDVENIDYTHDATELLNTPPLQQPQPQSQSRSSTQQDSSSSSSAPLATPDPSSRQHISFPSGAELSLLGTKLGLDGVADHGSTYGLLPSSKSDEAADLNLDPVAVREGSAGSHLDVDLDVKGLPTEISERGEGGPAINILEALRFTEELGLTYLTRPNRYVGPASTWGWWTEHEWDVVSGLDRARAEDLAVHLFNAYVLRMRAETNERAKKTTSQGNDQGRSGSRPKSAKAKGKKRANNATNSTTETTSVLQMGDNTDEASEAEQEGAESTREEMNSFVPPELWTAWPLFPAEVPDPQPPFFSLTEVGTDRRQPSSRDQGSKIGLEEALIAFSSRIAKKTWEARNGTVPVWRDEAREARRLNATTAGISRRRSFTRSKNGIGDRKGDRTGSKTTKEEAPRLFSSQVFSTDVSPSKHDDEERDTDGTESNGEDEVVKQELGAQNSPQEHVDPATFNRNIDHDNDPTNDDDDDKGNNDADDEEDPLAEQSTDTDDFFSSGDEQPLAPPVFTADDDQAQELFAQPAQGILAKLDGLLMDLHESGQRNSTRGRGSARENASFVAESTGSETESRSRGRSRTKYPVAVPASADAAEASVNTSLKAGFRRKRKRASSFLPESGSNGPELDPNLASKSTSKSRSQQRQTPKIYKQQTRRGLQNWTKVINAATEGDWSSDIVAQASERCARLFTFSIAINDEVRADGDVRNEDERVRTEAAPAPSRVVKAVRTSKPCTFCARRKAKCWPPSPPPRSLSYQPQPWLLSSPTSNFQPPSQVDSTDDTFLRNRKRSGRSEHAVPLQSEETQGTSSCATCIARDRREQCSGITYQLQNVPDIATGSAGPRECPYLDCEWHTVPFAKPFYLRRHLRQVHQDDRYTATESHVPPSSPLPRPVDMRLHRSAPAQQRTAAPSSARSSSPTVSPRPSTTQRIGNRGASRSKDRSNF